MQIINNKIIIIFSLVILAAVNICAGQRKNFFSHGPSVSSFAQGETVLNNLNEPSIIFYNGSLMSFFNYNSVSLARYNLFEGSSYNSASANIKILNNLHLGFSAINLASGDVEIRKSIFDTAKIINTNQWEYILAASFMIQKIETSVGVNAKYFVMDLYEAKDSGAGFDFSVSKFFKNVDLHLTQATIGVGLSANNIIGTGIKLDTYKEDFQNIFILSSMLSIPTKLRLQSQDTFTVSVDIRNEDSYNDIYTGLEYKLLNKYSIRAGYYPEHITAGFGLAISYFVINYSMDFNEIDLINRFSLAFRWANKNKVKSDNDQLKLEAEQMLATEKLSQKEADKTFVEAKNFYSKKQYLYATELLQKLIINYPSYDSPLFYYNKIKKQMTDNSVSAAETDFASYAYWAGYKYYYEANYEQASKEWAKYLQFDKENNEISEYYDKVQNILKDEFEKQEQKKFELEANTLLEDGILKFDNKKWIACIKQMEKLQNFVTSSNRTSSFNYYQKAKDYIDKAVYNLSLTLKQNNSIPAQTKQNEKVTKEEIVEIDEKTADIKYKEGLSLYAKGKYFEAERMWELTLRLNPNHIKARTALTHIRNKNTK
ncbi:hypothetical protein [Candidatus Ruminimicrobium bovinum]|uniref:hypothetical protein n=1 Tax=Candidatus Ruminimicrobium bovinum TaxID=3242779 RepID=UPI0039B86ADC